jgi:Flp pilus assembly protein TadD
MRVSFCQHCRNRLEKSLLSMTLHRGKYCAILIFCLTFLVFSSSLDFGFVNWDDPIFVTANKSIQKIDFPHLKILFTSLEGACYAPLSRLSAAIDYAMWGKNPYGFHLTNILLHALSACLVFIIASICLRRSGLNHHLLWSGATLSALLFSLHPLRVESVVWISERRDVLSVFFGLCSLYLYLRYTEATRHRRSYYYGLLVIYIAALLSKASVATLPVILLLLDIYPLRRITFSWNRQNTEVIFEKVPLLLLGFLVGAFATYAQIESGAAPSLIHQNWIGRFALSAASNGKFLREIFCISFPLNPLDLIHHYYSFDQKDSYLSFIVIILISLAAIAFSRKTPGFLIAWLGYLCLILPFTGLVQTGNLFTADRFSYLASVPLSIFIGGIFQWMHERLRNNRAWVFYSVPILLLIFLSYRTIEQEQIWSSSEKLWQQAIQLDSENPYAWRKLADAYLEANKNQEALECFQRATDIVPQHLDTWFDLACVLGKLERYQEAKQVYEQIIKISPEHSKAHFNLGWIEAKLNRNTEALDQYQIAQKLEPQPETLLNIGICYEAQHEAAKAIESYREAAFDGLDEAWIRWSEVVSRDHSNEGREILKQGITATQNSRIKYEYAKNVLISSDSSVSEKEEAKKLVYELNHKTEGKDQKVKQLLDLINKSPLESH